MHAGAVHPFIAHTAGKLVSAFVVPLVSLVYFFTIDWRLALITLIPVVAVALVPLTASSSTTRESPPVRSDPGPRFGSRILNGLSPLSVTLQHDLHRRPTC